MIFLGTKEHDALSKQLYCLSGKWKLAVVEVRCTGEGGSFWNPIGASERVAVAKQKEKLEALFSMQSIQKAFAE